MFECPEQAYLRDDGVGWSTEGVRLAVPAELEAAFGALADTSGVWCATLHLSIFAAFVDILLDCTWPGCSFLGSLSASLRAPRSANLLTPDGLQQILERRAESFGCSFPVCSLVLLQAFCVFDSGIVPLLNLALLACLLP